MISILLEPHKLSSLLLGHGMAKLARKVGGGHDAVIAMTGNKDVKLADDYSSCDDDDQKEVAQKIMKHLREQNQPEESFENVISFRTNQSEPLKPMAPLKPKAPTVPAKPERPKAPKAPVKPKRPVAPKFQPQRRSVPEINEYEESS